LYGESLQLSNCTKRRLNGATARGQARLAAEFAADAAAGRVPVERMGLVSAGSWGREEMLDPRSGPSWGG
jgi:hypothetical protein